MVSNQSGSRNSPSYLPLIVTLLRGPLACLFAFVFLVTDAVWTRVTVGLLLLVAIELTDLLDGILARRLASVTEWGAMLDPYMDSFSRLVVFWTLAHVGLALAVVPLVMALRDIAVAYCRVVLARNQTTVTARWSGKIKAGVQGVAAMVIVGEPVYIALLGSWVRPLASYVVIVVTVLSVGEYILAALRSASKQR